MFRQWQTEYAAHAIATFPIEVRPDGKKKPLVRAYPRFGLRGSAQIAKKFPNATALGFMTGRRSRLTILDIDTNSERVLADALQRHGPTPIIVRSGSGHYHAWYRWNGERRRVRPDQDPGWPIDILGDGGYVVAPPSQGTKASYHFIHGGLDDLDRLPVIANIAEPVKITTSTIAPGVTEGKRNDTLFRFCLKQSRHCDDLDALLDVAETCNKSFIPPLPDDEVVRVAKSAWRYEERGENRSGRPGAWFLPEEVNRLIEIDPDRLLLKTVLKANNGPDSRFMIANGMHTKLRWSEKRLARARRRMEQNGEIKQVRPPSKANGPALYQWGRHGGRK